MPKIIVIMPAYNVEKFIRATIERIPKKTIHKLIVIDDCSTDNTGEEAKKASVNFDFSLIKNDKNLGYGGVQKKGCMLALNQGADIVVLLHGDGQYAPEELPGLLKPLKEKKADIVLGSRILGKKAIQGGMPLYKFIGNKILTYIENISFGMDLSEYHSGYVLYSRKALELIPFQKLSNTFHIDGECLLIAKKLNLRIVEKPIGTLYEAQKSNVNSIAYGFTVLKVVLDNFFGKYDKLIQESKKQL